MKRNAKDVRGTSPRPNTRSKALKQPNIEESDSNSDEHPFKNEYKTPQVNKRDAKAFSKAKSVGHAKSQPNPGKSELDGDVLT